MIWRLRLALLLAFAVILCDVSRAQQECPQPPALGRVSGKNIFNEQQEIDLGDAMGDAMAREFTLIDDPALTAHLEELGKRLATHLPPNQLRLRFYLMELPEVNAFSIAGGRIYVARKMVALTRNDDELAGVLAHEMGHIVTHQSAIEMTRMLKQVLGVTEVGDRADIYDKFHRLLENERRKTVHISGEGEAEQYVADEVALFAMARAGFSPQAYVDLWDRFNATHGNAGSWLSDLLGHSKPEQKRLRELLKSVSAMPSECSRIAPSSSAEFEAWQARVIAANSGVHGESLPGLVLRQQLALPLRPDIHNLRFSPDGKYLLAQDDGGIHVLSRDPFEVQFFIEAPDADKAQFSPDSKSVVFKSPSLRVETWDIASQKRTSAHEVLLRVGCLQSALSPDGHYLACLDKDFALQLVEVATGKELASKKDFFQLGSIASLLLLILDVPGGANRQLVHLAFSPDGRHFLGGSLNEEFAYDLAGNRETKLPYAIRNAVRGEFAFMGNDRILGVNIENPARSWLLNFPGGEHLQAVQLAAGLHLEPTPQGKYVAVGPLTSGKRGFMDPATGKLNGVCKEDAGDIYDNTVVLEDVDGRISQVELPSGKTVAQAKLQQSHLGDSRAIAVSDDFNWLAASTRRRGAVWDLTRNVRVQHVRAFSGGWFSADDLFYADFPAYEKKQGSIAELDGLGEAAVVFPTGDLLARQEGPYLLVRTPPRDSPHSRKDWTYELRDYRTKKTIWQRHFAEESPTIAVTLDYHALLMGWPVSSAAAHEELRELPVLKSSAEKEDVLYELVDVKSGVVSGKVVVKTNKYSFQVRSAIAEGDWLLVQVSGERVLTYSFATAKELGHVFGHAPVISTAAHAYAVTTSDNEVNVYDLASSRLRNTFKFPVSVAYKRFSADGKRLFVLTRDQTAYVLDLDAGASGSLVVGAEESQ